MSVNLLNTSLNPQHCLVFNTLACSLLVCIILHDHCFVLLCHIMMIASNSFIILSLGNTCLCFSRYTFGVLLTSVIMRYFLV